MEVVTSEIQRTGPVSHAWGVYKSRWSLMLSRASCDFIRFFVLVERHGAFIIANKYRNVGCDVSVLMKRAIKQNV